MLREIRFKAWDINNKKWYTRVNVGTNCCNSVYDEEREMWLEFDELCGVVVQYTGLKDIAETPIYEGDQLFAPGNLTDEFQYVGDVFWDEFDARWEVHNFYGGFEYIPNGCVVKGNIYEGGDNDATEKSAAAGTK